MSYGYAIFNINIINQENYKEYIDKVKPLAKKLSLANELKNIFVKKYINIVFLKIFFISIYFHL